MDVHFSVNLLADVEVDIRNPEKDELGYYGFKKLFKIEDHNESDLNIFKDSEGVFITIHSVGVYDSDSDNTYHINQSLNLGQGQAIALRDFLTFLIQNWKV